MSALWMSPAAEWHRRSNVLAKSRSSRAVGWRAAAAAMAELHGEAGWVGSEVQVDGIVYHTRRYHARR